MADIKHVGRLKTTGRKVLVVFRTLPGEAYNCLVVATENLSDLNHDAIIQAVETTASQNANEFAEVLARSKFPDGSTMLPALHAQGKLLKVSTDQVEMTPNFSTSVLLSELNQMIAEQLGVAVDELAVKNPVKEANVEVTELARIKDLNPSAKTTSSAVTEDVQLVVENLTPEDQAKRFRSDADRLSKQAADMRRQAEELFPTVKKKEKTET
jgi:hypothetical protein